MRKPRIVLFGGTTRPSSSTERALRHLQGLLEDEGAETALIGGVELAGLPIYAPGDAAEPAASRLVEALRDADGIVVGSPGYHGGISGLVKNAIDYTEDLRTDSRPYFAGRPVGCVVTAAGWQGAVNTLRALRDVVHSLRGWPTPIGIAINSSDPVFDAEGRCIAPGLLNQMNVMKSEIMMFARDRMTQAGHEGRAARTA